MVNQCSPHRSRESSFPWGRFSILANFFCLVVGSPLSLSSISLRRESENHTFAKNKKRQNRMDHYLSITFGGRRTEDVDYWRKQAGWIDDDVAASNYNPYSSAGGSGSGGGSNSKGLGLVLFFKIGAVILSLVFSVLLFRALNRRSSSSRKSSSSTTKSAENRSRPQSRSRTSRSRSRSRRHTTSVTTYDLMDDNRSGGSKRSSRSRSRSRRSKSQFKSSSTKETPILV